jgi:hypothetical protein
LGPKEFPEFVEVDSVLQVDLFPCPAIGELSVDAPEVALEFQVLFLVDKEATLHDKHFPCSENLLKEEVKSFVSKICLQ